MLRNSTWCVALQKEERYTTTTATTYLLATRHFPLMVLLKLSYGLCTTIIEHFSCAHTRCFVLGWDPVNFGKAFPIEGLAWQEHCLVSVLEGRGSPSVTTTRLHSLCCPVEWAPWMDHPSQLECWLSKVHFRGSSTVSTFFVLFCMFCSPFYLYSSYMYPYAVDFFARILFVALGSRVILVCIFFILSLKSILVVFYKYMSFGYELRPWLVTMPFF